MNKSYTLTKSSSFNDIVKSLDKSGEGFLPIVDNENKLLGIVTDGDIRRAFLNKIKDVNLIINKKPLKGTTGISRESALLLLKKNHRRHLPIVDENNRLIKVIKLDDWSEIYRPNKVVIMAGGLGSRLGELTRNTPKPMLNIGDKPILENLIKSFKEGGFSNFIISVNYKSEIIKKYFGDGSDLGVSIKYLEELTRMGTAGALSLINPLPKENIFVVNGDILSSINFEKMLKQHVDQNSLATMAVSKRTEQIQYGVIEFDDENKIQKIVEKPSYDYYINAGAYVLTPECLNEIPPNEYFDMPSLFKKLMSKGVKPSTYLIDGFWLDIGLKKDYQQAKTIFTDKE